MSSEPLPRTERPSQTKIVATLGPASEGREKLTELIEAGVDVFRINMAHGDRQEHQRRLGAVHEAARSMGRTVGVLIDLAGPKIRLGELPDGQMQCDAGHHVQFIRGEQSSDPERLVTTYEPLVDELAVGDRVMLADGTVSLVVVAKDERSATCRVVQPGVIRSRQGVNLPGVRLSIPALSEIDRDNAVWAAEVDVDFVGLSFVRAPEEVRQLQDLLRCHGSEAQVIAKIEKPEALERLDEIVDAADGVMVARGDLGVETDIAEVAVAQKEIIAACNRHRKPVIIATQMLDSMQNTRMPTRAEVTDVSNAILDGADACMLSGETAIGKYPREAVEMMHRIALATEPIYRKRPPQPAPDLAVDGVDQVTEAITYAAGRIAEELDAQLVVVATARGEAALSLSKNRHFVPTVGVSDSPATLRRMCLYWGVIPLPDAPTGDAGALLEYTVDRGRNAGFLTSGDRVVMITGSEVTGSTKNTVQVHEVP